MDDNRDDRRGTWAVYINHGRRLVDIVNEGGGGVGAAIGSNWQVGLHREHAYRVFEEMRNKGYFVGREHNVRF